MTRLEAIKEYQCPGCGQGLGPDCATDCDTGIGCGGHCPGTLVSYIGKIFLGMPKGFNRMGRYEQMPLHIFESFESFQKIWTRPTLTGITSGYDDWNVPVWKFLDERGNTLVRGMSPRVNSPFLHVILGDCRDKIPCIEISKEIQKGMD